ncbi:hypothetical protein JCM19045_4230 [Bacillus sp. JCM 19045]|nr:hypothetical protein JCM19045_4230 [Bacillus sp. JCM 19045]
MNQFHKSLDASFAEIKANQNKKGIEKYGHPFNPKEWSNDQLYQHTMEELYDGTVYVHGMKQRMDSLALRNEQLARSLHLIASEALSGRADEERIRRLYEQSKSPSDRFMLPPL